MSKRTEDVERAMETLLTKRQIKWIKARTAPGPSKRDWVRKLVNAGITVEQARMSAWLSPDDEC